MKVKAGGSWLRIGVFPAVASRVPVAKQFRIPVALGLILLTGNPSVALALPTFGVSYIGGAFANVGGDTHEDQFRTGTPVSSLISQTSFSRDLTATNSRTVMVNVIDPDTGEIVNIIPNTAAAAGTVSGTAELGHLSGSVTGTGRITPAENNILFGTGEGSVVLEWIDTVHVVPGECKPIINCVPLSTGDLVDLTARFQLDSSVGLSGSPVDCTGGGTPFGLPTVRASAGAGVAGVGFGVLETPCNTPSSGQRTQSITFQTRVGSSFTIFGSLSLDAVALANSDLTEGTVTAFAEAKHTALFNLDVATPGAAYETDSGVTYLTQSQVVSEPSPLTVFVLALAVLGLYRWRHRNRTA